MDNNQNRTHVQVSNSPMVAPAGGYAGKAGIIKTADKKQFASRKEQEEIKGKLTGEIYFTLRFENVPYQAEHSQKDVSSVFQSVSTYLKHVLRNSQPTPGLAEDESLFFDIRTIDSIIKTYINAGNLNAPKNVVPSKEALSWAENDE